MFIELHSVHDSWFFINPIVQLVKAQSKGKKIPFDILHKDMGIEAAKS